MPSETIKGFERGTTPSLADDPMLQLTRVFVYFLQNLFRAAPEGMGMRWTPNEETSELIITDQKPLLSAVEKKPHITCVFGELQWAVLGLDQMQHRQLTGTGDRTHTDLVSSTMSFHCQSTQGVHSRRLGWAASYFTNVYRRILIKGGGLHQVGMKHSISAESPPTAYTGPVAEEKIVAVVTTIPFYWQPQWLIRDPGVVWRQMEISFRIGRPAKRFSAGEAARIRQASMYGKPVTPVANKPLDPVLVQKMRLSKFAGEE